jgi:hypothetical protein
MRNHKNILIIGGSLYGTLLASHFSENKNYKITLVESSDKLLNSLNSIKLKKKKFNNGFHGIELPRALELVNFIKKKLKIKLNILKKKNKILISRKILSFENSIADWPLVLKKDLKKNFLIKNNYKLENYFSNKLLSLANRCVKRFGVKSNQYNNLIIPWFLPKEYKVKSKDEGDIFRQKIKEKKLPYKYAVPVNNTFQVLQNKFMNYLKKKKNIEIYLNTKLIFDKKKISFMQDNNLLNLNYQYDKIYFCAPLAFLLKSINNNHFNKLRKFERFLFNVIVDVKKKIDFTEMICLNDALPDLNRISVVKKKTFNSSSLLQLEIIKKNNILDFNEVNKIQDEITKIFNLKNKCEIIDYKLTRTMYYPDDIWTKIAKNFIKKWIKNFHPNLNVRYNFSPINMSKAWLYSINEKNRLI